MPPQQPIDPGVAAQIATLTNPPLFHGALSVENPQQLAEQETSGPSPGYTPPVFDSNQALLDPVVRNAIASASAGRRLFGQAGNLGISQAETPQEFGQINQAIGQEPQAGPVLSHNPFLRALEIAGLSTKFGSNFVQNYYGPRFATWQQKVEQLQKLAAQRTGAEEGTLGALTPAVQAESQPTQAEASLVGSRAQEQDALNRFQQSKGEIYKDVMDIKTLGAKLGIPELGSLLEPTVAAIGGQYGVAQAQQTGPFAADVRGQYSVMIANLQSVSQYLEQNKNIAIKLAPLWNKLVSTIPGTLGAVKIPLIDPKSGAMHFLGGTTGGQGEQQPATSPRRVVQFKDYAP